MDGWRTDWNKTKSDWISVEGRTVEGRTFRKFHPLDYFSTLCFHHIKIGFWHMLDLFLYLGSPLFVSNWGFLHDFHIKWSVSTFFHPDVMFYLIYMALPSWRLTQFLLSKRSGSHLSQLVHPHELSARLNALSGNNKIRNNLLKTMSSTLQAAQL